MLKFIHRHCDESFKNAGCSRKMQTQSRRKKKVERKQQEEPEPEKNKSTTDNNSAQSTADGLPQSKPILIDYNTPKPKCRKIEG